MSAASPGASGDAWRDDWLWDLARVSAAALRRHRVLAWSGLALVFALSALAGPWLGVPVAVAAGLLAGGLVRVRLPKAVWLALAVPPLAVALAPLEIWIPGSPSWLAWPEGRAAFAGMGALTGFVVTQRVADVSRASLVACLLAGAAAFAVFGFDEPPLISKSGLGGAAALLTAIVCLGALSVRGGWASAWTMLAVPAALTSMSWSDQWYGSVAGAALVAPWAARTGALLCGASADARADSALTRLIVRLQTRAWSNSFLVLALGIALTLSCDALVEQALSTTSDYLDWNTYRAHVGGPNAQWLALVLLFHVSCSIRDYYARLAVWVAAALVPVLVFLPSVAREVLIRGAPVPFPLMWILPAEALVVLVSGWFLARRTRRAGVGAVGVLLLLLLALLPTVTPRLVLLAAWVAPVHWLVGRSGAGRASLLLLVACGVLSALVRAGAFAGPTAMAEAAAQWLAAVAVIVAARRVRSMTAVPAEHPIVADWGVAP